MMILMDGRAMVKLWDGPEGEESPFVIVFVPKRANGSYATVYCDENLPPDDDDATILWQSGKVPA